MLRSAIIAVSLAAAAPAAAFVAENGLTVTPEAGGQIRVEYGGAPWVGAFWCAAADFVQTTHGAGPATRLYRLTEGRRGSGAPLRFALAPPEGGRTETGLALLGRDDGSLSLSHALALCDTDARTR